MTPELTICLAALGLCITALAATGSMILHEFSGHELEEYCQRQKRNDRFDDILDRYESIALSVDALRIVGVSLFLISASAWYFGQPTSDEQLSALRFLSAILIATFTLAATNIWFPWTIAQLWSTPLLFHTWKFWNVVSTTIWPLTSGVSVVNALLRRLAGKHEEETDEEEAFEDEIRTMVTTGQREGLLEADAREMIEGVMELGDTDVSDIMTPRSEVDAFEIGMSWNDVLRFAVKVGRTRIPVFEQKLDNIVGVLFVKDLLAELSKPGDQPHRSIRDLLRAPWFVPKTKAVDDMLQEFLGTRSHLAIVLDEYDSVAGVVTIEDVLEEIVGEIVDESDEEAEEEVKRIDESTIEALGRTHLDDLNEHINLDFPESDDYDTVAGFIVQRLGHIPKVGESIEWKNLSIEVLEAGQRRVDRVRIVINDKQNGKTADTNRKKTLAYEE